MKYINVKLYFEFLRKNVINFAIQEDIKRKNIGSWIWENVFSLWKFWRRVISKSSEDWRFHLKVNYLILLCSNSHTGQGFVLVPGLYHSMGKHHVSFLSHSAEILDKKLSYTKQKRRRKLNKLKWTSRRESFSNWVESMSTKKVKKSLASKRRSTEWFYLLEWKWSC